MKIYIYIFLPKCKTKLLVDDYSKFTTYRYNIVLLRIFTKHPTIVV